MTAIFPIHDSETAPQASRPYLAQVQGRLGMVPNLVAVMAGSPVVIRGYLDAAAAFAASSFSPLEQHVVLQTVNAENDCRYCMAAHAAQAVGMTRLDPAIDAALRALAPLADARLEALRGFTLRVVRERGRLQDGEVAAFVAAGFTLAQALEVVLGVGLKTIANYSSHLAATAPDPAFEARVDRAA